MHNQNIVHKCYWPCIFLFFFHHTTHLTFCWQNCWS